MENNNPEIVSVPMTEMEYDKELKTIESIYNSSRQQLYIKYALSQAKYKEGNIITDDNSIILIDIITVSKSFGLPEPVYHGIELKKDLTPKKNGNRSSIYGNRNIKLLNDNTNI